ncbi:hypothetical protein [Thauera humireducens]|uniref:hypothetical protein n=1 Tax=Thauera humireducens TaxID=1134435 RepID=UPI00311ED821
MTAGVDEQGVVAVVRDDADVGRQIDTSERGTAAGRGIAPCPTVLPTVLPTLLRDPSVPVPDVVFRPPLRRALPRLPTCPRAGATPLSCWAVVDALPSPPP